MANEANMGLSYLDKFKKSVELGLSSIRVGGHD